MVKAARIIVGLIVLAAFAIFLVWLLVQVWNGFVALPPATMTAIAGVVGVLSVPIITYFTARALERRRSLENAIREHKTNLYDTLIRGLMGMLDVGRSGKKSSAADINKLFADSTAPLVAYGSRAVIRAWNTFRKVARDNPGDTVALMAAFEELLKAMRQDLGHSVWMHQRGELLGIFLTDADTFFAKKKSNGAAGDAR